MAKPDKIKKVAELKEKFVESGDFIVAEYRGLSVKQITDLRNKLSENGVSLKVVKNNLALIALKEAGVEAAEEYFKGPVSVAFVGDEAPAAAKTMLDFQAKTKLSLKAAYVSGRFFGPEETSELSKLPGRSQLLSQLAGSFVSVLSTFAGDMQSILSTFALSLKALEDKRAADG